MLPRSKIVNTRPFAVAMILLTTLFWGLGFPIMKTLGIEEQILLPSVSTIVAAMGSLATRFAVATILILPFCWKTLLQSSRREMIYGGAIGAFVGLGGIAQLDGLSYTAASTCGFLTAFYVVIVPVIEAVINRKKPKKRLWLCIGMVLVGIAVLSGVNMQSFRLGRGEIEALIGSVLFCGQILLLNNVDAKKDRWAHLTFFMFLAITLITGTLALANTRNFSDIIMMHHSLRAWAFILILSSICTTVPFALMNRFQPAMSATVASVIYCAEPIFVTLFALFLPELLVRQKSLYPNEHFTLSLVIGGGLITIANILVQLPSRNPDPQQSGAR